MLRFLYTVALYVAAPLALLATALRGVREPAYRERLTERFGYTKARFLERPIWLHAVSVGEVQAAAALIAQLRLRYPDRQLLVTTATPTGAQRVKALFGESSKHAYLPYDTPGAVRRFLDRVQPRLAIVMEREIWPNLYSECARRGIPLLMASARVSESSAKRHVALRGLFGPALANVIVAAQTEADANRYRAIGAPQVHVVGNVKFDMNPPDAARRAGEELRRAQFANRLVWTAGSTHAGEEEIVLHAHERVLTKHPDALLILVPRHPQRFADAAALLRARKLPFAARSTGGTVAANDSVLLGDTLGELMMFYAAADVAFVGGSLVPIGGHNLLEPAALARPTLTGPHNFNAQEAADLLLKDGGALQVDSTAALASAVLDLFGDAARRAAMGARAAHVIEANRGALARLMGLVESMEKS